MTARADRTVTVLRIGRGEAAVPAFEALRALGLPRAEVVLGTDHKVDGQGVVTVLNVEGDYPAALTDLRNTALLGAGADRGAAYLAAGLEAYCLDRLLHRLPGRTVLLWRSGAGDVLARMDAARIQPGGVGFVGEEPEADILVDGSDPGAADLVGFVATLYRSGGALSSTDYALPSIVRAALAAGAVR